MNDDIDEILIEMWRAWQEEADAELLEYITECQLVENGWIRCSIDQNILYPVLLSWLMQHCQGDYHLMKHCCLFVEDSDSTLYTLTWL